MMKDSAGWQNVSYPVTSMKGKEKKKTVSSML
jgi:hypothetical protein